MLSKDISIESVALSGLMLPRDKASFLYVLQLGATLLRVRSMDCEFFSSQGKHAKCKQYVGHSAHVTNVRFSHDDRKLVSVGGADTSVMVWRHNAGSREPVSDETSQSGDPVVTSSGFSSEDSDTDSEEEGTVGTNYVMMMSYIRAENAKGLLLTPN